MLDTKALLAKMLAVTYPVGFYLWTSDSNFDPNTDIGGTWELMDEGITLVSAGQTYTIQSGTSKDGGSEYIQDHTHSLTNPTVPDHRHSAASGYKFVETAASANIWMTSRRAYTAASSTGLNYMGTEANTTPAVSEYDTTTLSGTCTTTGGAVGAVNDVTTGSAGNMPPYKSAYCWHRTA